METAVKACLEGNGFRGAAQEFQVPSLTLKSYIRKQWEKEV
jgi:helix-turn-helix, Psq domain.